MKAICKDAHYKKDKNVHVGKVVAIGECGLDYECEVSKEAQAAWFEAQLELACSLNLPVVIHERSCVFCIFRLTPLCNSFFPALRFLSLS